MILLAASLQPVASRSSAQRGRDSACSLDFHSKHQSISGGNPFPCWPIGRRRLPVDCSVGVRTPQIKRRIHSKGALDRAKPRKRLVQCARTAIKILINSERPQIGSRQLGGEQTLFVCLHNASDKRKAQFHHTNRSVVFAVGVLSANMNEVGLSDLPSRRFFESERALFLSE